MAEADIITIKLSLQELIKLITEHNDSIILQNKMIGHIGMILNFFATVLAIYVFILVISYINLTFK